ncbi:MAG: PIN domain-containing protein [Candidatus Binatia bacterium]
MAWAIFDTSVYIAHWEQGLAADTLADLRRAFIVRHSAVVLSELRRGARTLAAQRLVAGLFRLARPSWEPTAADWWEAGRLVRTIGDANHWEVSKRREFQNDALIAFTARRHGATIVTTNHQDFALLADAIHVSLLPV